MSNNQKSRFVEVLEWFETADIREANAALGAVTSVMALRDLAQVGITPEPKRRGRRPGSKNRPAEETQAAAD